MKAKLVRESLNILKAKPKDEVLNKLKKSGKTMDQILIDSAKKGFLLGTKYALDNGVDDDDMFNSLQWAASNGHTDIVKLLIDNGVDIHFFNDYALRWAASNGHYDVVKLLIENGAKIHANNNEALRWAVHEGHYDVIKLLLENGADVRAKNNEALRFASVKGYADVVELLKKYIDK